MHRVLEASRTEWWDLHLKNDPLVNDPGYYHEFDRHPASSWHREVARRFEERIRRELTDIRSEHLHSTCH